MSLSSVQTSVKTLNIHGVKKHVHQQHVLRNKFLLVLPIYVKIPVWIHESNTLLLHLVTSEFFRFVLYLILLSAFNTHSTDNIVKFRLFDGLFFYRWK